MCFGFTLLTARHVLRRAEPGGPSRTCSRRAGRSRCFFVGHVHSGQHFFAFYSVILSFLLIHYYFDHFVFLQRDKVITPSFARP